LTPDQRASIARGASERDLAHSGLEDSMIEALKQVRFCQALFLALDLDHHLDLALLCSLATDAHLQMRRTQAEVESNTGKKISLRVAAYVCAINKVAKVVQGRGSMMSG
jgi:hypothetical protein